MGKKKGKQSGEFDYKSQNALHRHTVYVDRASEANKYRNPLQIGRGLGYRSAYNNNDNNNINNNCNPGYWHSDGSAYGGGDKWSSIFSSNRSNNTTTTIRSTQTSHLVSSNNRSSINANLSRLRHLLEERRSEDRVHDREHRLRLQRSRMLVESFNYDIANNNNTRKKQQHNSDQAEDRHEPGWLLSYDIDKNQINQQQKDDINDGTTNSIPSLQQLASQTLGPLLPMYCAAIGTDFVSESLKSVSADILSQLSISLAKSSYCWSSGRRNNDDAIFATTDGTVKALVHSGVATGLVLRGAPPPSLIDMNDDTIHDVEGDEDDDTRMLSDNGLLALCPRILSTNTDEGHEDHERSDEDDDSSHEHWESIDFDLDLNSRMNGCFHLQRLELIDIPLRKYHDGVSSSSYSSSRGGISIHALRSVLRACSNITHLSLSGCFYNWESEYLSTTTEETDNISTFLCGKQSIKELANSFVLFGRAKHLDKTAMHLLPQLLFRQMFEEENVDQGTDIVVGLDELLPELRVLDVSHCNWITPEMIIQFLLKLWGNAIMSSTNEMVTNVSRCESEWDEKDYKHHLLDAFNSIHLTNSDIKKQCEAKTSLVHLNIRGSTNLISESSSWLEGWRKHGLFDGIDVSMDRHVRT